MDIEKHQDKILIVDRIEDDFVVCEELETQVIYKFDLLMLEFNPNEGDVLVYRDGYLFFDYERTKKRKEQILDLFDDLFS